MILFQAGLWLMCPICKADVRVPRPSQDPAAGLFGNETALTRIEQAPSADVPPATPTDFKAKISLVLGLVGFCLPLLCSIPAIIFGVLSLKEIRRSNGRLVGRGLAAVGIACGVLQPLLVVLLVVQIRSLREEAAGTMSRNKLRQMALAFDSYHDAFKSYPQQAIYSADGKPLLSWRVTILPYIEQDMLFKRFNLDEPWDSDHNIELLPYMPAIYKFVDGRLEQDRKFVTVYQGFVGKNALFRGSHRDKVTRNDIKDGPENTLAVVEAARAVPWTKPEDLPYDSDRPLPILGGHLGRSFNASLLSGLAVYIDPDRVSEQTIRDAITINDGRPLESGWPTPRRR